LTAGLVGAARPGAECRDIDNHTTTMSRLAVSLAATAVLLAGCAASGAFSPEPLPGAAAGMAPFYAASPAGNPLLPEVRYACDDATTVVVQYGLGRSVGIMKNGEQFQMPLLQVGSGWYGTPTHGFQVRTGDALLAVAGRPAVICEPRS
jgi:hypothetical protein